MYVTLTPAYGRDYKSKKEVLVDWNGNKDFVIQCMMHPYDGKYATRKELMENEPDNDFSIRYGQLMKVLPVK